MEEKIVEFWNWLVPVPHHNNYGGLSLIGIPFWLESFPYIFSLARATEENHEKKMFSHENTAPRFIMNSTHELYGIKKIGEKVDTRFWFARMLLKSKMLSFSWQAYKFSKAIELPTSAL